MVGGTPITKATQITTYSPCKFGLYRSLVGADVQKNDFLENITTYAQQEQQEQERLEQERLEQERLEQERLAQEKRTFQTIIIAGTIALALILAVSIPLILVLKRRARRQKQALFQDQEKIL